MFSEERTDAVGARVIRPKENEYTHRQQPVVGDLSACQVGLEREYVDGRERQGDVHLSEHRVSPVLNGIFLLQIEFADEQVNHREQVGNERCRGHNVGAIASESKEQIDTCRRGNEAIDIRVLDVLIDQTSVFPERESRDEGEEQNHRIAAKADARHHNGHEQDACDGSNYEIFHPFTPLLHYSFTPQLLYSSPHIPPAPFELLPAYPQVWVLRRLRQGQGPRFRR